jgi:hypothetical protein
VAVVVLAVAAAAIVVAVQGNSKDHVVAVRTAPRAGYAVRGVYGHDASSTGFDRSAQLGFNLIDSSPAKVRIDELAARGLKGLVWLGGFSNATCRFAESDAWIRTKVGAIAGNPGVGAYFIDDEPNAARCPNAPNAIRARAALVHSIDPSPPTLMVTFHLDQLAAFAHATDVIGLDHYPCSIAHGCDFNSILDEAAAADRLGIRYWGVIQAYGDSYYKVPTPAELDQEFKFWSATRMEGFLVFAWRWPPDDSHLWLVNNQALQSQLALENRALGAGA